MLNFQGEPKEKELELSRIAPPWDAVHVYDFFRQHHLGVHPDNARIPVQLAGHGAGLFTLVPAHGARPALLAVDRHLSQTARARWFASEQEADRVCLKGEVPNLVAGSRVELVFTVGELSGVTAASTVGEPEVRFVGDTARVTVTPVASGAGRFEVCFAPRSTPLLSLWPESRIVATPEHGGRAELVNLGGAPCRWAATTTSARITLQPAQGELAPHARAAVQVVVDSGGLMPGQVWTGDVQFGIVDAEKGRTLPVFVDMPPPPNLARDAEATASSVWSSAYIAMRINDGSPETRWNSGQDEQNGAWVQLEWDEPVSFNRVVVDECTDFGPRVREWRLEADGETVARGTELGREYTCMLERTVTAGTLRFVAEKVAATPTLWEIRVFDWPEPGGEVVR